MANLPEGGVETTNSTRYVVDRQRNGYCWRAKIPVEIIGEVGNAEPPGAEREWINAECHLAIKHLKKVCGEPPPEMELEVQWQEHELGDYPMIVLAWEGAMRGAPWKYIEKCEEALTEYVNR
jgi:hypothetical protein